MSIDRRAEQRRALSPEREEAFRVAEKKLQFPIEVYQLGERFEGLPANLASITMLDVTRGPGCHYGVKNIFVPIIRHMEEERSPDGKTRLVVSPETAILVEPSTGNGWVAFSDAADMLGYEHMVVMPDGLPEPRYRHPQRRKVEIFRTPKEGYAEKMSEEIEKLIKGNRQRVRNGEKIYVSPDHARKNAEITIETMSELGRQLLENIRESQECIRVVISMGNGASLCAVGEYVKKYNGNAKVVATESFAYGGGYDYFAKGRGRMAYSELFGIDPGHSDLMAKFSAFGTNAPIGKEMPLQIRAMDCDLIDDYVLFGDEKVLEAYLGLQPREDHLRNALALPNYSQLPPVLYKMYGNSTLANIAAASHFTNRGERVVAMAYDGRQNY